MPSKIPTKLSAIRELMASQQIDAWIVPSNDPHQSEYVADHWKVREWISGFTGSAGTVVVTADHAGLWTDSRYFSQAEAELAGSSVELHRQVSPGAPEHEDWLLEHLDPGSRVAFDGELLPVGEYDRLVEMLGEMELELVTDVHLPGSAWPDRPELPLAPVTVHPVEFAGLSRTEKLNLVRQQLELASPAETYLVTALDEIAWVLNLRGSDVGYNPVFYAYLLIESEQTVLFLGEGQLEADTLAELSGDGIQVLPYHKITTYLAALPPEEPVYLDEGGTSVRLMEFLSADEYDPGKSLIGHLKSLKNPVEIGHFRKVMEKDGVALLRLYRWLESALEEGSVTEVDVAKQLDAFRAQQAHYVGESFPAIAAYGANAALPHYRPLPGSCATLKKEGIFLLDSGGQYLDGTTDITRTIALGAVTAEQKRNFTLVLKGHIALGNLVFPVGTRGNQLDAFARQYLWREGLDYGHGTGHGVGFFLNVHEGPHGIRSGRTGSGDTPFLRDLVTSNEPGYYEEGNYGIRIENLVLTVDAVETSYGKFLRFEDLTLFPMDRQLIDESLLNPAEKAWLDQYHQMVWERLSPHLDEEEKAWLKARC